MSSVLKIKNGWFYGAGSPKVYNWVKDGYNSWGVGIKKDLLENSDMVYIRMCREKENYKVPSEVAMAFAKEYHSIKQIKGSSVYVVSKSILIKD